MQKTNSTLLIIIIFFGLFLGFNTVRAESIEEFNSTISVDADSSVLVEESITYDFEGVEKHGIFRTIPLKNSENNPIKIHNIYVSDNNGNEYNYTKNISNDVLTIKIGDADRLVTGIKEYHIAYRVFGAIGYYEDYDEIYWNVTGNDWIVPIKKVQTRVFFPEGTEMKNLKNNCYVGTYGSNSSCQIDLIYSNGVSFIYENILNQGEGMTIATGFNKNIVDHYIQPKAKNFSNYIIVLLPIILFIVSFLIWRKNGKDPKGYSTIIAQYEPPKDIKPTLAGVIVSEKRNYDLGMIAGIIYLAEQGFLKIYKVEKKWLLGNMDYQVELIKEDLSNLGKIEIGILNLFFDKLIFGEKLMLSELNSNLIKRLDFTFKLHNLRKEIDEEIKNRGLVDENSAKLQLKYFLMSFPVIIISVLILIISNKGQEASALEVFSMIISLCIFMFFGVIMGKKTKKGAEVKDHLLGFKKFLSVVEKDRLDFHNAPEKNPEKFMEFLPYAIALGVEKKWAKHFDEIYIQQQSWYVGGASSSFLASDFTSEISQFSTSVSSASGSSGSGGSGGGGSSGGGGGGGGGGSW